MKHGMRVVLGSMAVSVAAAVAAPERPHIVLIMVDDMGFSDPGFMGGEIATPNLDALAGNGVRFSQFYNSGRCCPTRATLMTGLHPHQAGIGWMTTASEENESGAEPPAYQGYLNRNCATIAEVLRGHGYATLMAGKWHLGKHDRECWPLQRGFEKFYGVIDGACRFFHPAHPRGMTSGNENIEKPESTTDAPFYTTDAFTDHAIRFIREEMEGAKRPTFTYLAYNAPHWPLQAFEEDIARYRGKYKIGWDKLREQRYRRQIESGLIDPAWPLSPRTPEIPDWDSLDDAKKDEMDLKMAVFAAMVDRVDQNIGKLTAFLREAGIYDTTLIFFLSDNGACQEGGMLGRGEFYDIEKRNLENANSYGEAWSNAGNTPFRLYKHHLHEGGSATPFFMHWPSKIRDRRDWYADPGQILDIMPTILDVAGATYPETLNGNRLIPIEGVSLRPAFDGQPLGRKQPIFFEHEFNAAVRDGDWKLVGLDVATQGGVDPTQWELYNLAGDRTELRNLVHVHPEKAGALAAAWERWAERVNVYPKGDRGTPPKPQYGSPQVQGRAFTLDATIESDAPRGIVMAQGGNTFGYSLYVDDEGKPNFAYRNNKKLTLLTGEAPLKGKVDLNVKVDESRIVLSVGGTSVASKKSPGLLEEQPGLGLFIGAGGPHPIGPYEGRYRFRGRIHSHRVIVAIPKSGMRTPWGENVNETNVWREYPRPALRRDAWTNLNGYWDYAITPGARVKAPDTWDGRILVPFAVEAPLSGVERRVSPDDALWYRRPFAARKIPGRRHRLNFEAVDYETTVWVNDRKVGTHVGGNLPFSFDITDAIRDGDNTVTLRVLDSTDERGAYQLHGKQRLNPRGIWYTPVSGIWQTVWMEDVPEAHVADVRIAPKIDGGVCVAVTPAGPAAAREARVVASLDGRVVAEARGAPGALRLKIPEPKLWSPDSPVLYDLRIEYGDDVVHSYVGLREVGRARDADGYWRFTLNGGPIFHWGTLDQGWWPDGLLTPPSDEAMASDIRYLKEAGFNMIRKHIKIEPRRYYTHCDRIGMMLWQDQPSHSSAVDPLWIRLRPNPPDPTWPEWAHKRYMAELQGMIDTLYNHPSIVQWVPFNERWGQHQTMDVGQWTVGHDPSRQVNIASGGNWFPVGHIVDHHQYPHPAFPFELGAGGRFDDYIKVVGEFGGHGFPVEGHVWDPRTRNWGYGGLPENKEEWMERYRTSIAMLAELKKQGIAGGVYTQTTDVEGEINGLITYDRKVQKISAADLKAIHAMVED